MYLPSVQTLAYHGLAQSFKPCLDHKFKLPHEGLNCESPVYDEVV